jgi:phage-related protein
MNTEGAPPPKPKVVVWVGSSRRDLKTFPEDVQANIGYAL